MPVTHGTNANYVQNIPELLQNIIDKGCRQADWVNPVFQTNKTSMAVAKKANRFTDAMFNKLIKAHQSI